MREHYPKIINGMLSKMYTSGIITSSTKIIIPNLKDLLIPFRTNLWLRTHSHIKLLKANEYPLYVATNRVDQSLLGNFTNTITSPFFFVFIIYFFLILSICLCRS
jgi:hypothetical protein